MVFTGVLREPTIDWKTGRLRLVFEPNEDFINTYEELKGFDKLSLEIKRFRAKRSLNANAYFHVLCTKIAEKTEQSMPRVKNLMLRRYGQLEIMDGSVMHLIIREDIDVSENETLHLAPTTAVKELDDGRLYRVYRVMRGSHTYDTKEMARLIEGTITEAKDLGIDTITPKQAEEMLMRWGIKHET